MVTTQTNWAGSPWAMSSPVPGQTSLQVSDSNVVVDAMLALKDMSGKKPAWQFKVNLFVKNMDYEVTEKNTLYINYFVD